MWKILLIIGSGSFAGGISRFLLTRVVQHWSGSGLPYGTFAVNILGCFLIGIFYGWSEKWGWLNDDWRMFLTVGFCGGFTTFSAFANENVQLLRDGSYFYFLLYAVLSVISGIIAVVLGNITAKIF